MNLEALERKIEIINYFKIEAGRQALQILEQG